jgi:hypothetical protein
VALGLLAFIAACSVGALFIHFSNLRARQQIREVLAPAP